MNINVDSRIKPLYANLLRLGIGDYLISTNFKHLSIECDFDQIWNQYNKYVRDLGTALILVPGYTGYAEKALGIFLTELIKTGDREAFIGLLGEILMGFAEWSDKRKDFSKVKDSLLDLGYSEAELNRIFFEGGVPPTEPPIDFAPPSELPRFERTQEEIDETLCFVLMPFDPKFKPTYDNVIKKVVESVGLTCKRADESFIPQPIMDDIWANIQKARVLIADLSEKNPNVFYELGLAHAINKDVILITKDRADIAFDVQHWRIITYDDSISGGEKLEKRLKKTLEAILRES